MCECDETNDPSLGVVFVKISAHVELMKHSFSQLLKPPCSHLILMVTAAQMYGQNMNCLPQIEQITKN